MAIQCTICLDDLKDPVSIPCGHVYCSECIMRTINAIKPYSHMHNCPTCRTAFVVSLPNSSMAPPHLKPHLTPSVRRIYLNDGNNQGSPHISSDEDPPTSTLTASPSSPSPTSADPTAPQASQVPLAEYHRLQAENTALRMHCAMWRKRAEVHSASTLSFLELTKTAKYAATKYRNERDLLQMRYDELKRRIGLEESELYHRPVSRSSVVASSSGSDGPSKFDWALFKPPILEDELEHPCKRVRRNPSA